ncbi:MAG: hypothetical protein ACKO8Q_02860, partial [Bacteroidota bacterium]
MKNFIYAACILLLSSCSQNNSTTPQPQTITTDDSTKPQPSVTLTAIDSNLTRTAMLIAGKDSLFDYNHSKWDIAQLNKFRIETEKKYARMVNTRLNPMMNWSNTILGNEKISDTTFAFYPFSGGDFIHLQWLYPNANNYLMVAKESVGSIPNLTSQTNTEVLNYLLRVDNVLRDIYSKSYFITKNMIRDIKTANIVDGMLPVIVWACGRTNYEICSLSYFFIDANASEIPCESAKATGVRIKVKHSPTQKIKTITYLSTDISNSGFTTNSSMFQYLQKAIPNNSNSFVKSASYLLHYTTFSQIRDLILSKSKVLIQDDTGIPFKFFKTDIWNVHLYGKYEKPVKDFSENLFQS